MHETACIGLSNLKAGRAPIEKSATTRGGADKAVGDLVGPPHEGYTETEPEPRSARSVSCASRPRFWLRKERVIDLSSLALLKGKDLIARQPRCLHD